MIVTAALFCMLLSLFVFISLISLLAFAVMILLGLGFSVLGSGVRSVGPMGRCRPMLVRRSGVPAVAIPVLAVIIAFT